jgi:hypothetical protein
VNDRLVLAESERSSLFEVRGIDRMVNRPKNSDRFRKRWLQLSIRSMLLAVVFFAVLLSFFVIPARSQLRSRRWVESQQGRVVLRPDYRLKGDWYVAPGSFSLPKPLVDNFGIDFFVSVKFVELDCKEIYDLSGINGLTRMEELSINQYVHDVRAFDALRNLPRLKKVTLSKFSLLSADEIKTLSETLPDVDIVQEE